MVSIGTLTAFIVVSLGVIILRVPRARPAPRLQGALLPGHARSCRSSPAATSWRACTGTPGWSSRSGSACSSSSTSCTAGGTRCWVGCWPARTSTPRTRWWVTDDCVRWSRSAHRGHELRGFSLVRRVLGRRKACRPRTLLHSREAPLMTVWSATCRTRAGAARWIWGCSSRTRWGPRSAWSRWCRGSGRRRRWPGWTPSTPSSPNSSAPGEGQGPGVPGRSQRRRTDRLPRRHRPLGRLRAAPGRRRVPGVVLVSAPAPTARWVASSSAPPRTSCCTPRRSRWPSARGATGPPPPTASAE